MSRLVVISQMPARLAHELGAHWVTIGRGNGNGFQIVDSSISGQHCEVRLQGEQLLVRDLRSTNGTFIQGVMVSEGVLKPGETLRLGDVELRLEISAPVAAPSKMESPAPAGGQPQVKPARKFQVVLVDDSMAFLEMISELFEDLSGHTWEIHSANAADKALVLLQQNPISLIVLDIGMPMLDGVQLLGMINKRYPEVKKVVLTGGATESLRASCLANGADLFLEKPISPDGIKFVFNVLNDLLTWSHREGFSGTLRQVDLSDIIQIQCLCRNSCILELRNAHIQGEIFIEEGAIIHASVGELTGEPAIRQLFTLSNGEFQLYPFRQPTERSVQGPWELLLLEAARARDEQKHQASEAASVSAPQNPSENKPAPAADENPAAPQPPPADSAKPPPQASQTDTELPKLGEDIVVVSTYEKDGKWHPKDEPNK